MTTAPSGAEAELVELLRQVVADYALGTENLHATWRCGYPDTYGPCHCIDEFINETAGSLAGWVKAREAAAWENGAEWAGAIRLDGSCGSPGQNPYVEVSGGEQ